MDCRWRVASPTPIWADRPRGVRLLFGEETLLLGPDLLAWLVLAIGAAMAVGSFGALVRPPEGRDDVPMAKSTRVRSLVFIAVGLIAAIWALATLLDA